MMKPIPSLCVQGEFQGEECVGFVYGEVQWLEMHGVGVHSPIEREWVSLHS